MDVKEAIVDLYLAIKIRSTEEVSFSISHLSQTVRQHERRATRQREEENFVARRFLSFRLH